MSVTAYVKWSVAAGLAAAWISCAAVADQIDPASALAQKFSEAAPAKTAAQRLEEQRAADEKEMLTRARAEAEARRAADLKAKTTATAASSPAPASPAAQAAGSQKQAEAKATPDAAAPPAAKAAGDAPDAATRVSVLLVLNPGASDEKKATTKSSPIVCLQDSCYVSTGPSSAATGAARADAIHSGALAGACNSKSQCVYRGVALKPGSFIQIVDLGPAKLVRMETIEAKADKTCQLTDGSLVCDQPITAPDYRIWIVPEAVAEQAGPNELEAALADELPEENVSRISDK